jgi:hypothetical protein
MFPLMGCLALFLASATIADALSRAIASGIGLAHIAGGAFLLWKDPASVVELDRPAERLRVKRWGLFGRRTEELPLSMATGAEVEVGEHTDGGAVYRPTLVLAGGEKRPVSMFWYQTEAPSASVAARINAYLGIGP